jgi:hypothetical protein
MLLRVKLAAVCPNIPLMNEAHAVSACSGVTAQTRAKKAGGTRSRGVMSHPNMSVLPSRAQEAMAHTIALKKVTG